MGYYFKGGLVVVVLIVSLLVWYNANKNTLPVNVSPETYSLIDKMEKSGAPDFQLTYLDGNPFEFKSTRGKIVILNFWASWCDPCVQEFPSLIKLIEHFKGDVQLVAVSGDENQKDIEAFLKAFGLPQPNIHILWDKDRKVNDQYGVAKIPESFLIGKDGKLIRKVIGIDNWYTDQAVSYFSELVAGTIK